jgi:hypothetical protein
MVTTSTPKQLSDRQLAAMLELARDSDSVELKVTVPESQRRATAFALGMDPLDAQIRLVYFFDTPELALDKHGVVVRARRVQGRGDDSVVKLRPVVPHELSPKFRASPNLVIEVDALPGGYVCSAAMKRSMGPKDVQATMHDKRPIRKLFSKEQRQFFAAHAPSGVELDDLSVLGPILVLKLRFTPVGLARKVVAEQWQYPDSTHILELSTKSAPDGALQAAGEARAFLSTRGVDLSGEQRTKTKTALEFFARQLTTE